MRFSAFYKGPQKTYSYTSPIVYTEEQFNRLTNNKLVLFGEVVLGDLEVERSRASPYTAGDIVVGAVAGAEPTAVVAGLADGHTTQVGADTYMSFTLEASKVWSVLCSCRHLPNMTSHSGFWTRSSSLWGSRRLETSTLLASAISSWVRCRMKTGLPRHLMMT